MSLKNSDEIIGKIVAIIIIIIIIIIVIIIVFEYLWF